MATITISNFDESLRNQLSLRAERNGRSIEDEVEDILKKSLLQHRTGADLVRIFREKFAGLEGTELEIPPRDPVRDPPDFGE